ncbi:MAG: DUF1428 domain-containing protein [Verrucomicrobiales bacterium]|nr:DUF1428 domain-containing protein [Verrucomicrobiae bacterium]
MSQYIDGYVLSVPTDKIDAYKALATKAAAIWKEHGALEYRECLGDDLDVKDQVPFPKLANTQAKESVIFSYVVYASREARDEVNAKVMADPRIAEMCEETQGVFDCKRMAYGGFRTLVHQ